MPGLEPLTFRSKVQRTNHYTMCPYPSIKPLTPKGPFIFYEGGGAGGIWGGAM